MFYLKMEADMLRYKSEYAPVSAQFLKDDAKRIYNDALDLAKKTLSATNKTRLGLALSFCVFYHEILCDDESACKLAQTAFEEGKCVGVPERGEVSRFASIQHEHSQTLLNEKFMKTR